jgi:hypothetical protein
MKLTTLAMLLPFAAFLVSAAPVRERPPAPLPRGFTVYDSLVARPDDPAFLKRRLNMAPMIVDGRSFGFDQDPTGKRPNEARVRALARRVAKARCPLLIDIEHLPMDARYAKASDVDETIRTIVTIIRWLRDEHPRIVLGLYDLPNFNYYDANSAVAAALQPDHPHYAKNAAAMREAHADARRAAGAHPALIDAVDFLCPQLYTYTREDDPPHRIDEAGSRRGYEADRGRLGWYLFAAEKVRLCRELAPGKPVVPILWPRYHKKTVDGKQEYLPGPLWRAQLETVRLLCDRDGDGVILWDSRRDFEGEGQWGVDTAQPWWTETAEFMKTLRAGR